MRAHSCQKTKIDSAQNKSRLGHDSRGQGSLKIVGIGPGDTGLLSQRALKAIGHCQLIVGYTTYVRLLGNLLKGKEVFSSGMTHEIERVAFALKMAREGKDVCLISSGDPGIYGMAGLALELLSKKAAKEIALEIIPGVSATGACASLLGAPLSNDFAVISLSDLLTERKQIAQRINLSAKANFVLVLYNPKSKKRIAPLRKAWQILSRYRRSYTPVGIVKNAYRSGQKIILTTLKEAQSLGDIDMTTTIIVGNSETYIKNGSMITPRGYHTKKSI